MNLCFFVSDLHGKMSRYSSLFHQIEKHKPKIVLLGGDLLPHLMVSGPGKLGAEAFATDYLPEKFRKLKARLGPDYPEVLLILGNDDPRYLEEVFLHHDEVGLWHYMHGRCLGLFGYQFAGYAMIPPTPFQLKDWERYDVSRFVDPGCLDPTEGFRTVDPGVDIEYTTMQQELEALASGMDLSRSVFLFHSPPYQCLLDRAALDGRFFEHVPLDVHVGSIAIQRFIQEQQPYVTLHGHIHESTRITGQWQEHFGRTVSMNGAHDGGELALVSFYLEQAGLANRKLC